MKFKELVLEWRTGSTKTIRSALVGYSCSSSTDAN